MNARDFIHRQLGTAGWAPIDHGMAVLLCPDVVNAHRDFAIDARAPENLPRAFPGTRLYSAQVEGVGAVPVLSRSSLILAERMQFLGFAVTAVTEYKAAATVRHAQVLARVETSDQGALQHAGVVTKEPPRACRSCGRMSSSQTCLAALMGELPNVPKDYRPDISHLRRCVAFAPPYGTSDDRTGRQLWPEIAAQVDQREAKRDSAIEQARILIAGMLARGSRDAAEIFAAAQGDNIHERTVQRAAEAMDVVRTKAEFSGGWIWSMPETATI